MSSDVKWPRRAVCKRFGYEVEQASAGAKWVVTNRLPVPSSVVIGDSWSDVDGEGFLKFKIWEEVLKPFDLSTLDTAGVFHVEAGATQLANDLAEMGFSMEAVKPAPVETFATSQPADVPQWCRDAAREFYNGDFHNTAERLAAIIARHAGAAPEVAELTEACETVNNCLKQCLDENNSLRDQLDALTARLSAAEAERDEARAEIKRARHGCITYDAGPHKSVLEMEIAMLRKRVDEAEPKAETADAIRAELAAVTAAWTAFGNSAY